jgi:hypothetical protein
MTAVWVRRSLERNRPIIERLKARQASDWSARSTIDRPPSGGCDPVAIHSHRRAAGPDKRRCQPLRALRVQALPASPARIRGRTTSPRSRRPESWRVALVRAAARHRGVAAQVASPTWSPSENRSCVGHHGGPDRTHCVKFGPENCRAQDRPERLWGYPSWSRHPVRFTANVGTEIA